jgi:glycosyltransferase involved in cell wall biosynthesis
MKPGPEFSELPLNRVACSSGNIPPGSPNVTGPLHIVHGILSLDVGGLERIVLDLIRAARRQDHRVSVVCVERRGQLAEEAEAVGITMMSLDKPAGRLPEYFGRGAKALASLEPDVIHTHQIGAAWYLGQAAQRLGIPVIHTEHGNHFRHAGLRAAIKTRLLMKSAARYIDRFCCVSDEIAAAVTRWGTVPRRKVEVVANGISMGVRSDLPSAAAVRHSLGIPLSVPVIGTVGRLAEVKRQDILIRAVKLVMKQRPDVRLLIVGDGPERPRLEVLARELGIAGKVHFTGYQSCPEQLFQVMNVFSLTSQSEGFPISLLEAWRAELPVACTSVGGIPKIVEHEADGLLFSEGEVEAAALSFERLLGDADMRCRLGKAGQRKVMKLYSIERMASDYAHRYAALLGDAKQY